MTISHLWSSIVCCFSVAYSCPALCDPMDCSVPDFLVLPYLPEFAQTHVHWLSDGWMFSSNHFILCRPLPLLPSIFPNINVFSNELVLHIRRPKYWIFGFNIILPVNIQSWFPLGVTGLISLLSKGLSCVFSSTTVQKHQFFSAQPSLWSNSDIYTWLLEKL